MALISRISLLDKDLNVSREIEYGKLLLVSPIIRDILYQKYMPALNHSESADRLTYAGAVFIDRSLPEALNNLIEEDGTVEDQVAWHISHEKAFESKHKSVIASVIKNFLALNDQYTSQCRTEHYEQFNRVAEDISKIEEGYAYFNYEAYSDGEGFSPLNGAERVIGIIKLDASPEYGLSFINDAEQE